jgi:hypothetical protein
MPVERAAQLFKSKVDRWVVAVFGSAMLVVLLTVGSIVATQPRVSGLNWVLLILPLALGIGLPVWLFATTSYTIDAESLMVRAGPMTWVVPLKSITRIEATNSILSAPALSMDRLAVSYGLGEEVVISPKEKVAFVEALARAGVVAAKTGA